MNWNTGQWLQVSSMILVFVSLLLSFFIFTVPSKNKKGNIFLGLYLLINALDNSSYFYHEFVHLGPTLEMIRIEVGSFLKWPFLFLFVCTIVFSNWKLRPAHLLHLLPIILGTLVLIPRFYLVNYQGKVLLFKDHTHSFEGSFTILLAQLQLVFYIIVIFIMLSRYKKIVEENYSAPEVNYRWLLQMNFFLAGIFLVSLIMTIYKFEYYGSQMTSYRLIMLFAHLTFICWLVLNAMYGPTLFTGIDTSLQPVSAYLPKGLQPKEELSAGMQPQVIALREYMTTHQPYMNPDLTIKDLAKQMNMDVRELSIMINHSLKQNFNDFINRYRIDTAMAMLKDPQHKKLTVLEILYHVGFNSKSTFNTAFKKLTGLTPTEYRKQHMP